MTKERKSQSQVSWNSGNITGSQIVVGDDNTVIHNEASAISHSELKRLRAEFNTIKQRIEATDRMIRKQRP